MGGWLVGKVRTLARGLLGPWVLTARLERLRREIDGMHDEVDALRSRIDLGELHDEFQSQRMTAEYVAVFDNPDPLITVCIGTYNRAALLVERALRSVLAQTYSHLEIIVVGDGCTDDTGARIAALGDGRIRFVNLAVRGQYPSNPNHRWMVAGTTPINHALSLAHGDFITHLDDDDEYLPGRISELARFARERRADFVWHPFHWEVTPGTWVLNGAEHFRRAQVTTSSVFYHRWFARIPWDIDAYRYLEPGDWNRFRKVKFLGATALRYPIPLTRHFLEGSQGPR